MTEFASWIALQPVPIGDAILAMFPLTLMIAAITVTILNLRRDRVHERRHAETMRVLIDDERRPTGTPP